MQRTHRAEQPCHCPFQPLRAGSNLRNELVGNALEDVDPLDRQTGLPGVEEAPDGHGAGRQVEVGIVAHDGGIRAAKLEGDVFELIGGAPGNVYTGARFAGEPDLAHQRMADDLLTDDTAGAGHDVQHACRQVAACISSASRAWPTGWCWGRRRPYCRPLWPARSCWPST